MTDNIADFYRVTQVERFPHLSELQVSNLENRLQIALPLDYRHFLLKYNGGVFPEPYPTFAIPGQAESVDCLTALYGIGASYTFAELGTHAGMFAPSARSKYLAIGYTLSNLIFIGLGSEDLGCIYLKLAFSTETHCLSSNIEEFFGLLQPGVED